MKIPKSAFITILVTFFAIALVNVSPDSADMLDEYYLAYVATPTPTPSPLPTPTPLPTSTPTPTPTPEPTPTPTPTPGPEYFVIAMMGDCTFGAEHNARSNASSFQRVVGDDYAYPFSMVRHLYEDADFAIVNFEAAMSEHDEPADKRFRFNAPKEYVNVLHEGGINYVSLGNNHSKDYGEEGYNATKEWLEDNAISFAPYNGWSLYTTERGLTVGVYSHNMPQEGNINAIVKGITEVKAAGAEVIIFAPHWGIEGSYRANASQKKIGRAAIDAGAHIVMGTHPHTLQETEEYKGRFIYYSLANWIFGGSVYPRDKDTVLAKVTIMRDVDGSISVVGAENIPCSVSSITSHNDFRPTPYEPDSPEYLRVLSKLDGSFTGPDLVVDYGQSDSEDSDDTEDSEDSDGGEDNGGDHNTDDEG